MGYRLPHAAVVLQEAVCRAQCNAICSALCQKTIVVSAAVPQPVSIRIGAKARYDTQIDFRRQDNGAGGRWLPDSKFPGLQLRQS